MRDVTPALPASFAILAALVAPPLHATWDLGAEIDLYYLSGDLYEVRLLLWKDCSGNSPAANATVTYSSPCGSGTLTMPLVATFEVSALCALEIPNSSCNGGSLPGLRRAEYSMTVGLPACDAWLFQYSKCCFGPSQNVPSDTNDLVVHTTLNNFHFPCRDGPRFAHPGIPFRSSVDPFTLDLLGMINGPGYPEYALVDLLTTGGTSVTYDPGFSGAIPYPNLSVSATTGVLTADSAAPSGHWTFVEELYHIEGGDTAASVERTFMLPTATFYNIPPPATDGDLDFVSGTGTVASPRIIELQAGGSICTEMSYTDPDAADVLSLWSDATTALPGATIALGSGNTATAQFCWTAPAGATGMHRFRIIASNGQCPLVQDQHFLYSVHIVPDTLDPCGVVGITPALPTAEGLQVIMDARNATLTWELPANATAARVRLFDLRGAVLVDRSGGNGQHGTLPLPPAIADGTYLLECGAYRSQVTIIR